MIVTEHWSQKSSPHNPKLEPKTQYIHVTALVTDAEYIDLYQRFERNHPVSVKICGFKYEGKIKGSFTSRHMSKGTLEQSGIREPMRQVAFELRMPLPGGE